MALKLWPSRKIISGVPSLGNNNSDPIKPILTKLGEQVGDHQQKIPYEFCASSLHRIHAIYS